MDALGGFERHLKENGSDLLREMIKSFARAAHGVRGRRPLRRQLRRADPGASDQAQRLPRRDFDTRAGTIPLAIPKLRRCSYFPEWLLKPRRQSEQALTQVVCQCYVEGVSTRRVSGLEPRV